MARELENFTNLKDLIHEAHEKGLKGIKVEVTERHYDKEGKPLAATATATVVMEDDREFVEEGDAHITNVGRTIQPHVFRMAQSRAVARALRLATDNGETSVEEMSGDAREEPRPSEGRVLITAETRMQIEEIADEMYPGGLDEMTREFREKKPNWALERMSEEGGRELLHRLEKRQSGE